MSANRITVAEWKALHASGGRRAAKKPKAATATKRPTPLMRPTWHFDTDADALGFIIPVRLVTLENQRKHWKDKARQAAKQKKQAVDACFWAYNASWNADPLKGWLIVAAVEGAIVTLTRCGVRRLDPGNIEGCFKHLQDGIADWLGLDDGSPMIDWIYKQETGDRYGVRVRIEPRRKSA